MLPEKNTVTSTTICQMIGVTITAPLMERNRWPLSKWEPVLLAEILKQSEILTKRHVDMKTD